jgi:solute carrier family 25 carnitine/acylcarnitine transporter 20/29
MLLPIDLCRELLEPGSDGGGSHSPLALWGAGGLAGALSWLSMYPFDVVKTRCQAGAAAAPGEAPYRGALDCARRSYASEGAAVFVRGLFTTLGRAFLVNGAIFSAYELAHKLLTQRQQQQQQQQPQQQQL